MSLPFLQTIGITPTEADLYELLLRLGDVPIAAILKETKLKRPTAYKTLYSLEKKGLVTKKDKQKKIHFQPVPPTQLLSLAEKQYSELERARDSLQALMPELTATYTTAVERPVVRVLEGIEGVKKAHREILSLKLPISAYVSLDEEIDSQLGGFWQEYYTTRRRDAIFARVICPNTSGSEEYQKQDAKELRQTRLVPEGKFSIGIEMDICGDKVAYFSRGEHGIFATIITNRLIAQSEQASFELAWERAEHYDQLLTKPYTQPA